MSTRNNNPFFIGIMQILDEKLGTQFDWYKRETEQNIKDFLMIYIKYTLIEKKFIKNYYEIKNKINNLNQDEKREEKRKLIDIYNNVYNLSFEVIEKGEILNDGNYIEILDELKNDNDLLTILKSDIINNFRQEFTVQIIDTLFIEHD
jgi:hypothetical protein